jgi:hypothetical protein
MHLLVGPKAVDSWLSSIPALAQVGWLWNPQVRLSSLVELYIRHLTTGMLIRTASLCRNRHRVISDLILGTELRFLLLCDSCYKYLMGQVVRFGSFG